MLCVSSKRPRCAAPLEPKPQPSYPGWNPLPQPVTLPPPPPSPSCRPAARPVCRTRCNIKPVCGGNQWSYGGGNSFSCGNGNSGYNPGYGYNPAINIQQVTEESIDVSSPNFTRD